MIERKKTTTKKSYIRTLLTLLLSLLIAFSGWYVTKQLLKYKEAQLLAKSGQLQLADSGYSLQTAGTQDASNTEHTDDLDNIDDTGEPGIFQGKTISEDMMAKILDCWASDGSLLTHDPQKGQMNMEQAITAGEDWIANLVQKGFLPASLSENKFQNVNAILYSLEEKTDIPDDLLSRWIISYTTEYIRITLSIHAATGQVWQAEIVAQGSTLPFPAYIKDEELLKAAFPFLKNGGSELSQDIESGDYRIQITSAEQKICGKVQWSMYEIAQQNSFIMATLRLGTVKK